MEGLRALYELSVHDCAVVEHILDIDQAAVKDRLKKIIRVMEMQNALSCAFEIFSGRSILFVKSFETSPAMRSLCVAATHCILIGVFLITSLLSFFMSERIDSSVVFAFLTSARE